MMTEPDVTLTDYVLTLECIFFACCLWKASPKNEKISLFRKYAISFFLSISIASLTGGTVHGFFLDESSFGYRILWPSTLISIGAAAWASWCLSFYLLFPPHMFQTMKLLATVGFALYSFVILFITQIFFVAIINYLPAVVFLFVVLLILYHRSREPRLWFGLSGLIFLLVAPFVQQLQISLHPLYFNHNAFYHLLQGIAFFLIYVWCVRLFTLPQMKETL